jgi:hypothetical protein
MHLANNEGRFSMQKDQKLIAEVLSRTDEAADKHKTYEPPLLQELGSINAITSDTTINMSIE